MQTTKLTDGLIAISSFRDGYHSDVGKFEEDKIYWFGRGIGGSKNMGNCVSQLSDRQTASKPIVIKA